MSLDLQRPSPLPQVFNSSISVDNMTWWFWIKAGIGFAIGSGVGFICWGLIVFMVMIALGIGGMALGSALSAPQQARPTLRR
jgi:uncharacterized membrane protein